MRICLINDTTSCHAGSRKVMDNIRSYLTAHEITSTIPVVTVGGIDHRFIDECDVVVVNAEGSIHHNAPWGLTILKALKYAQSIGKRTFLLNALYEKMDRRFDDIIAGCDVVIARELYSYNNLKVLNPNTELFPDFCVLNSEIVTSIEGVVGGIYKTKTHHSAIYKDCFQRLNVDTLSIGGKYTFDQYVSSYANIDLLLTGQHHAVYAAMMAGTPFIPTFSNSHKIESFLDWMDIPVMMCTTPQQVDAEMRVIMSGGYASKFEAAGDRLGEMTEKLDNRLKELFNV